MSKRLYTADPHFGHANILKYCPERLKLFGDINKHDKALIKNWNDVVTKDNHVWILGDFAFASLERIAIILNALNGFKHLIVGNHDKFTWSDYIRAGFSSVQRYAFINIDKIGPVGLAHDPSCCIVDTTVPWLVGHLHQQFIRFGNAINVGMDVRGFHPVSEEALMEDFRITKMHMQVDPYAEKEILGKE